MSKVGDFLEGRLPRSFLEIDLIALAEELEDRGDMQTEALRQYQEKLARQEQKSYELASNVGNLLGFDVGRHTLTNSPLQNAIDGVSEMQATVDMWRKQEDQIERLESVEAAAKELWKNSELDGDISTVDSDDLRELKTALEASE